MAWICFPFTAKSFPCHKITSESQGKMRSSGKTLVGKQWREVLVTAGVRGSPPPRAPPRGPHLPWDPISAGTPPPWLRAGRANGISAPKPLYFPFFPKVKPGASQFLPPLVFQPAPSQLGWQPGRG